MIHPRHRIQKQEQHYQKRNIRKVLITLADIDRGRVKLSLKNKPETKSLSKFMLSPTKPMYKYLKLEVFKLNQIRDNDDTSSIKGSYL